MSDSTKTESRFAEELKVLRARIAELERAGAEAEQTQAALRESEERYRLVAESTSDCVYWRSPDGRTLYVSPACVELTGYKPEALRESPELLDAIVHPNDRDRWKRHRNAARAGGPRGALEFRIVTKQGETRWVSHVCRPMHNAEGAFLGTRGSNRDITDRRRVDEVLQESVNLLHAIINATKDTMIAIGEEGLVAIFNPAAEEMFGRSREEVIGKPLDCLMPEEYRQRHQEYVMGYFATGEPHGAIGKLLELPGMRSDGTTFPMEISLSAGKYGSKQLIVGVARDITERKRVEEEQRACLERVQGQQAAIVNLATNEAAASGDFALATRVITEVAADAMKVERVGVWLLTQDRRQLRCADLLVSNSGMHSDGAILDTTDYPRYFEALAAGRSIDASDARSDQRTSEYAESYLVPLGITAMLDAPIRLAGEVVGVVCHEHVGPPRTWQADEITFAGEVADQVAQAMMNSERRRAEEEKQRLETQIRHAQKLESLGVLAGGIAHDFNNLLVGVLGYAGLAEMELAPDSPALESIQKIEKTARRAADLTRQLLAYSGRGRFVVEPLNLTAAVEEMAHLLAASISKKAGLRYSFAEDLPAIEADAAQIQQVVMNLITNASDAIGDQSGAIAVSTGVREVDQPYLADTYLGEELPDGSYVYVEVADTGCGMDEETKAKVFDPFFTTKFTGRGLGLAAVLGIVRGHRGAIRIQSEPGQGTTVTVLFPRCEGAIQSSGPAKTRSEARCGTGTILVVDDEETVRAVAKTALERAGFTVLTAANGSEALHICRERGAEIAAVLLDMTMPHLSGEEVFHEMRRVHPDLRVLLTSGYNEQEATSRFVGKGLAGFMQKPYLPAALVEKMHEILAE